MSPSAQRGRELFFNKGACTTCHLGADFTDEQFHNIGVGVNGDVIDVGRTDHTGNDEHWGQFKTPGLRNIALTAPYMHDGSMRTLLEVVEHYDTGGMAEGPLSGDRDKLILPLNLTGEEKADLVEFMLTLDGEPPDADLITAPKLPPATTF